MNFAVIGHPVAHSISPSIHGAAYAHLGVDHRYTAIDCPDEKAVERIVARIRSRELAGVNVTVPYKRVALALADDADSSAAAMGAANVLLREGNSVVAYNTDATALSTELELGAREAGRAADRGAACVIGSGGAALAAVVASFRAGASEVAVTSRKWVSDVACPRWAAAEDFRALGATPMAWPTAGKSRDEWRRVCSGADFVVQATSAGMRGGPDGKEVASLVPWGDTPRYCFGYDVVYNPPVTPFLELAEQSGRGHRGGLGMLVGQAADAFTLWLGVEAPRDVMTAAARVALFGKESA